MADSRRGTRRWAGVLLLLGALVAGWAGLRSGRLQPSWFDPDDGPSCARVAEGCPADIDAALAGLWWWVGVGGAIALAGLVLLVRGLATAPRSNAPAHPLVHAGVLGALGGVVGYALVFPLLFTLFVSAHAVPLGVGVVWLIQAAAVGALDHRLGGTPPRRAFLTGLAACALAAGATFLFLSRGWSSGVWPAAPVVDGAALALCVAIARAVRRRPRAGRSAEVWAVAACAVLLVVVVAMTAQVRAMRDEAPRALAEGEVAPPPSASSAPSPLPVPPVPAPSEPPLPPVAAEAPCAMEELAFSVGGFDAAMGARAAALEATNVSTGPCWVGGVPVVTLLQGGGPLSLTVEPGQSPSGGPALPQQRVGLAPGGSALALLTWRTYGGLADAETPQSVTAALDAASPQVAVPVVAPSGPAPFDLADGGTWEIAPWAPPWS